MSKDCVFCQITSHQAKAEIAFEDDDFVVFHDIKPSAPVHLLIVPKKHLRWQEVGESAAPILGRIFEIAPKLALKLKIKDSGFKLVMNCGKGAGQIIDHFHLHLLGGWESK